jgi:hypothetical protein
MKVVVTFELEVCEGTRPSEIEHIVNQARDNFILAVYPLGTAKCLPITLPVADLWIRSMEKKTDGKAAQ